MRKIPLETPLAVISGIGPRFAIRLKKLGLLTVHDLLRHFPSRYEDLSQVIKISEVEAGMRAAVSGVIQNVRLRRTARKNMAIVEATIADETGEIHALWFNQPYLANTLRPGRWGNFAGKIAVADDLYLQHPEFEIIPARVMRGDDELRHTGRLVPIYPETRGLTSKGLRFLIQPLLKAAVETEEWIPKATLAEGKFPETNAALRAIHFPATLDDALAAKRRFAFEELFLLQLSHLSLRSKLAKEKARPIAQDIEFVKKFIATLPFELTFSQKRSLWEILKDIERPQPMNRLLQGDVGSGKTVVAAIAAFLAAREGLQTAFMAPTEILARQHFRTLANLVKDFSERAPSIAILTSNESKVIYEGTLETSVKKQILTKQIKSGAIDIVVGTHALIEKTVSFPKLALVVIDEQHRFGVRQRAQLVRHAPVVPHLLSMSATPIPRTLMLTVFGDLDISIIDELPTGRKPIETRIVPPAEREAAYEFIRGEVRNGRQVFVICPRIEPAAAQEPETLPAMSQKDLSTLEFKSVLEEYEKLSKKVFPDLAVAMLHGKMPGRSTPQGETDGKATKESVMREFTEGKVDILVSTSVVEVGVDIPNASVMMIEGSERFGLAQLYQFRGRVGRGEYQSYCFFMTDSSLSGTAERLQALLKAKNGLELAEYDLKIRGPGEFFGERQTGLPDYAMRAVEDPELVKLSRDAAAKTLARDAALAKSQLLKQKLEEFQKTIHLE